jgi:aspartate kinase
MGLIVQKFGGTSVGSPERIASVADRIAKVHASGDQLVVVVSAMGHTTDELIALAHKVSKDPPHREMDMLLTAGERISMALLSMALSERKVAAVSFTGSQSGIITDGSHRSARIKRILGDRVRHALWDGKVAIVAGFQGVSETKEITTLGRGGSDTTAVAIAAALKADRCEIFTDVDGVYTADPRLVPSARLLPHISHDKMVELATRGAGVLHPRSVELAKQFSVRLSVRNSLSDNEGTQVVTRTESKDALKGMEEFGVTGVTADKNRGLVRVELMRPGAIGALWSVIADHHLSVIAPMFSDSVVQFFAEVDTENDWKKLLQELAADGFVKSWKFDSSIVPLSVVGDRFSQDSAALRDVSDVLSSGHIPFFMGSSSALALSVAVPRTHADDAIKALHARFFAAEERK